VKYKDKLTFSFFDTFVVAQFIAKSTQHARVACCASLNLVTARGACLLPLSINLTLNYLCTPLSYMTFC